MRLFILMSISAFLILGTVFMVFANEADEIKSTTEVIEVDNIDTIELSIFEGPAELEEPIHVDDLNKEVVDLKKLRSALPLLMLFALTIGGSGIFMIRRKEQMLRNISMWALFHPKKTRMLLTGAQLLLIGLAMVIGKDLHNLGLEVPKEAIYLALGAVTIGAILYPKKRKATYSKNFMTRKTLDLILPLAGMIFLTAASNQYHINPSQANLSPHIISAFNLGNNIFSEKGADLHNSFISENKKNKDEKKNGSAGRLVLAILSSIVLLAFLLATTCVLGCIPILLGGGGTVGWIIGVPIWVIGTALSVYLTIKLFNSIVDKENDEKTGS